MHMEPCSCLTETDVAKSNRICFPDIISAGRCTTTLALWAFGLTGPGTPDCGYVLHQFTEELVNFRHAAQTGVPEPLGLTGPGTPDCGYMSCINLQRNW